MMLKHKPIDLVGKKFGRLTVIKFSSFKNEKDKTIPYWECICDCGNIKIANQYSLTKNNVRSCGCLLKETSSRTGKSRLNKPNIKNSKPSGESGFNFMFSNYKNKCGYKNIPFNLTKEEFKFLTQQECYYCGDMPYLVLYHCKGHSSNFIANGIDRLDSSLGYTLENCVSCCKYCNYAKRDRNYPDFISHIDKIYNHIHRKDFESGNK